MDATNAIDYSDFSAADLGGRPSSDLVAEWAANAWVVKAFGNTRAKVPAQRPNTASGRRVAFLSGNDPAAHAEVGRLAAQFGFEPIDLGRNDAGGSLHAFGGPLAGHSFLAQLLAGDTPPDIDLAQPSGGSPGDE